MGSPTAADAASILDGVRRTRRDVRARYLRTFFGRGWMFSFALGVATFGSIAVTSLFGTRTTDGGQAVFAVYWTVMGLATLVAVWVLHRREPIRGPTETHVVTSYTMSDDATAWAVEPPIGRPIWNTRVYVLGERLEPGRRS